MQILHLLEEKINTSNNYIALISLTFLGLNVLVCVLQYLQFKCSKQNMDGYKLVIHIHAYFNTYIPLNQTQNNNDKNNHKNNTENDNDNNGIEITDYINNDHSHLFLLPKNQSQNTERTMTK